MFDQIVIFFAEYVYLVVAGIAFCFVIFSELPIKNGVLAVGILSAVVALVAGKILNRIIESPRPFMAEDIVPLFPHSFSNGFPSEHTLFAIVIACTIFLYNQKLGGALIVLTLGIGLARVLANVHYPVDVFGGLLIGIASVCVGLYIFSHLGIKKYLSL